MDKLSDFFKELKERASNPLFFSFLISWPIFNWKVVIALLFEKLPLDGHNSYTSFIAKQVTTWSGLVGPVLVALAYTFAFPFLRNIIFAFSTWIKSWGNAWNIRMSKESSVSMHKYVELRNTYEQRTKLLEVVIKQESQHLQENEGLRNQVLEAKNGYNEVLGTLQKWLLFNDIKFLDGTWELTYSGNNEENIRVTKLTIKTGNILRSNAIDTLSERRLIEGFCYNLSTNQMSFIITISMEKKFDPNSSFHYLLGMMDNGNLLTGLENNHVPVEFRRI
ncbi:MAG: hypothetical protein V4722_04405 [Bacteroidota bacterium]